VYEVEWAENPEDPTRGTATIRLNPDLEGFSDAHRALERRTAQQAAVKRFAEPSSVAPQA